MIEIHLYGELRRYMPDPRPDQESVARLAPTPGETIVTLLERLSILPDEIGQIFLNGALLSTRNSMALWLGYQQARDGVPNRDMGLETPVRPGDRVGLFDRTMAMLVV
ncbi:MAG: hypothetical protein AAGB97_06830 [Dehalococcoidia bacterium]|nr:hypothetical protein [Chloroflexota bacterium]MBT9163022.1 hypothetical protein [Chloroflexota bacterium]